MIRTAAELQRALAGTMLAGRPTIELPVPEFPHAALAVAIEPGEVEAAWRTAKQANTVTGRWPVATTVWRLPGDGVDPQDMLTLMLGTAPAEVLAEIAARVQHVAPRSWEESLQRADLFSRWGYAADSQPDSDVRVATLLAAADAIDGDAFAIEWLAASRARCAAYGPWEEFVSNELQRTRLRAGTAPSEADVARATLEGRPVVAPWQLERWLMRWEAERGLLGDPAGERHDPFEPDNVTLLFLPGSSSWDALAYLSWWGASLAGGAAHCIALARRWEQRFGFELVAHWGTMLQGVVTRPPRDSESAFELAAELDAFAPCTCLLPGQSLRHFAHGLVGADRFFLHERP